LGNLTVKGVDRLNNPGSSSDASTSGDPRAAAAASDADVIETVRVLCMRTNIRSIRRTIRNRRGTPRKCSRCLGYHDDETAASTLVLVEASHKQIHSLTFHISKVYANSHSPRNLFSPVQSAHTHGIQYLFIFSDNARSFYYFSLTFHVFRSPTFPFSFLPCLLLLSLSPGPTSLCHPIISFNYGLSGARSLSCFSIVVKQQRFFFLFRRHGCPSSVVEDIKTHLSTITVSVLQ